MLAFWLGAISGKMSVQASALAKVSATDRRRGTSASTAQYAQRYEPCNSAAELTNADFSRGTNGTIAHGVSATTSPVQMVTGSRTDFRTPAPFQINSQ